MSGCCSSAVFGWDCPQHVKLEIPLLWSELLSLFKSRQNKYIQWEAPKSNGAILCQVKLSQRAPAINSSLLRAYMHA